MSALGLVFRSGLFSLGLYLGRGGEGGTTETAHIHPPIKPRTANFEVAAALFAPFPSASIYEKGIFSGGKCNTEQKNDEGISELYRPVVAPLLSVH